jgi:predicted NUDIX family NTP pyrophosphohydrolase
MPYTTSAGLLMYSRSTGIARVLLAHMGGPWFAKKDDGSWTIPKGLVDADEDLLHAACREFAEETGLDPTPPRFIPLGSIVQRNRKQVHAWAFEGEWEEGRVPTSNTFTLEWPPRSGRRQEFPEIDRAEMFTLDAARRKIIAEQIPFLDRLEQALA